MSSHRSDYRHSSSRRDYSPSRRDRDRRDSRRSSPGPSRARSPSALSRSEKSLPEQFGRQLTERRDEDDDGTVLQCMKRSFTYNPLGILTRCVGEDQKLKVWTRNYKEIRGICTGYIVAFDKHWNMILRDVEEVYLKPAKAKTPYLNDIKSGETLPELPVKVPKQKKDAPKEGEAVAPAPEEGEAVAPAPEVAKTEAEGKEGEGKPKKQKKKRKKKVSQATKRFMKQCFVRGDNIVMVSIVDESQQEPEAEEEPRASQETSS